MAYIGALMAMWRGYSHHVVKYLLYSTKTLVRHSDLKDFPVPFDMLNYQEAHYASHFDQKDALNAIANLKGAKPSASPKFEEMADDLCKLINNDQDFDPVCSSNALVVTASGLPSGGARRIVLVSLFTSRFIQGPHYQLSDGCTTISLQEALMWANVNPFSPLHDGTKINPY